MPLVSLAQPQRPWKREKLLAKKKNERATDFLAGFFAVIARCRCQT